MDGVEIYTPTEIADMDRETLVDLAIQQQKQISRMQIDFAGQRAQEAKFSFPAKWRLGRTEGAVLKALIVAPQRAFLTNKQLSKAVCTQMGREEPYKASAMKTYINGLRRKLKVYGGYQNPILNKYAEGFRVNPINIFDIREKGLPLSREAFDPLEG